MNKDQRKGAVKNATGKLQRTTGKLLGNRKLEAKGLVKQIEGKSQARVGDLKAVLKTTKK